MKLVLQRVTEARVLVSDSTVGEVNRGLVVFLGVAKTDTPEDADYLLAGCGKTPKKAAETCDTRNVLDV
jgi:D-Tyr-tRNAtyr deacylase